MTTCKFRPLLRTGIIACLIIAGFATTGTAAAKSNKWRDGSTAKPFSPIYFPHTKSYFELRIDLPSPPNWQTASRYARTKIYKGVRGRLAQVNDLKTHSFLKANFEITEEAWIGMRYFCSFRKLVWLDGTEHPRRGFKAWARQWYRDKDVRCSIQRFQYMPIYYLPASRGFRWQASGPAKYFFSYFIEYQTGSENPKKAKPEKFTEAKGKDPEDNSTPAPAATGK